MTLDSGSFKAPSGDVCPVMLCSFIVCGLQIPSKTLPRSRTFGLFCRQRPLRSDWSLSQFLSHFVPFQPRLRVMSTKSTLPSDVLETDFSKDLFLQTR